MPGWSRLLLCCCGLLAALGAPTWTGAEPRPVTVGVYHNPPKILLDANGWPSGILGDLLQEIARQHQWQLQPVRCSWQECLQQLAAGTLDLLPDVAYTPERSQYLDFHRQPALHSWSTVYARPEQTLTSVTDLQGLRIGVLAGSTQEAELGVLLSEYGIAARVLPYDDYDDAFAATAAGELDAVVSNRHFGDRAAPPLGLTPTPVVFMPARLFYAAPAGQSADLLQAIDQSLSAWLDTPQSYYYQVLREWNPRQPEPAVPSHWWWLLGATALGLLLLAALVLVLRRLVRQRTHDLLTSEAKLQTILDSVQAAIYIKDLDLRYQYANRRVCEILGRPLAEILGHQDSAWFDTDTTQRLQQLDREILKQGKRFVSEETNRLRGEAEPRIYLSEKMPLRDRDGRIYALCGIATDITEQRRLVREIQLLSRHDPLTRLPNRRQLLERLAGYLLELPQRPHNGALLVINLDHMRKLNEALGQQMGDLLLQQAAQRLAGCAGAADLVARLGADEFALLLNHLGGTPQEAVTKATAIARHVLQALSRPYNLAGEDYQGSASVGIALFADPQATVDDILRHADAAVSQAKVAGRNTFRIFHPDMSAVQATRLALEQDLRAALETAQFVLHYQPQIDAEGEIFGYEALIRWRHPSRGLLLPGHFLPLAEGLGLTLPMGRWVLRQACRQLAQWRATPAQQHLTLAINLSVAQLRESGFVEEVMQALADSGADPRRLEVELTESQLIEDLEATTHKLRELRGLGVRISLDDFGTGYSSLNYLKQLPLDQLKIDMSFIRDLVHDPNDVAIVRTIISLAHSLGLQVLAEGVENDDQRHILLELGCRRYQGYGLGRPEPWPEG